MCTAIKQNEEDRLTNGNPPTLNVPLDAYVAVGLFNKKDTSKDVNPRKACGSPFATNESYICMVTSRHFSKHFFFFYVVLTYCAEADSCLAVRGGLLSLCGVSAFSFMSLTNGLPLDTLSCTQQTVMSIMLTYSNTQPHKHTSQSQSKGSMEKHSIYRHNTQE